MTAYTETVDAQTKSVSRSFDAANRLQTSMDATAGTTSYIYDANGNLTEVYPPGSDGQNPVGVLRYDYDQRNLMVSHETNPDGTAWVLQAAYVYDGANDRLQQVDGNSVAHTSATPVTTTYTNDVVGLTQVLVADDGTSQVVNLFGLDLISQDRGSEVRTLLVDGLGSVRVEMVAGVVETATTYEPYGEVLQQTGTSGTVYDFTGEQEDGATGLLYLRARYYNSSLKTFMTQDSWRGNGFVPGSLHAYLSAYANPLRFTDPTGHSPFPVPPAPPLSRRIRDMETFRDMLVPLHFSSVEFSLGGSIFDITRETLNTEIDFVEWMFDSGRLDTEHADNWWGQVNGYAVAAREPADDVSAFVHAVFPCFEYRDLNWSWGGPTHGTNDAGKAIAFVQTLGLEPALEEWVYLVWFMDYAQQSSHEMGMYNRNLPRSIFWKAHNAGIREGVDRAAAARGKEDPVEQEFINYVLFNVLYPGDQCARAGSMCGMTNQLFLAIGARGLYPDGYPAKESDISRLLGGWFIAPPYIVTYAPGFDLIYDWLWDVPRPTATMEGAELYRLEEPR